MLSIEIYWLLFFIIFFLSQDRFVLILNAFVAYNLCVIKFIQLSILDLDLLLVLINITDVIVLIVCLLCMETKKQQILYTSLWLFCNISNYQIFFTYQSDYIQYFLYYSDKYYIDSLIGVIQILIQKQNYKRGIIFAFITVLFFLGSINS